MGSREELPPLSLVQVDTEAREDTGPHPTCLITHCLAVGFMEESIVDTPTQAEKTPEEQQTQMGFQKARSGRRVGRPQRRGRMITRGHASSLHQGRGRWLSASGLLRPSAPAPSPEAQ